MENSNTLKLKDNLIKGPVLKQLILFFLPIAAGTLFQQLYNAVDAFVVSKYVGTEALAAVGGSPAIISNLFIGFFVALTSGCAVIIAQLYGSRRVERIKDAVLTSYVFCFIIGLVVGGLIIVFSPEILRLVKTTPETFDDSLTYQKIYFLGTVFLLVFNMGSGILRAVGNSKFPFACLFAGCGCNIVLDLIFVVGFKWGVSGVAWATVISEGVSCFMVTIKLMLSNSIYKLDFFKSKFSLSLLKQMLKIGIPSGFQTSLYGISNLIQQIGVNELGTLVVASWAMSGKVDGVFWSISSAFGTAVTTFVGQNYGAKRYDRVKEASNKGLIFLGTTTLVISGLLLLIGKTLLGILTKDVDVIDTTYKIMTYFVPFYVTWIIIEVYSGVLRGIGDTLIPSIIQAVLICGFRIVWVYTIFRANHTLLVLALSYGASWVVTDIPMFIYYRLKAKKLKLLQKEMGNVAVIA